MSSGFIASMADTKTDQALEFVRRRGIVRPRDLQDKEIPPDYLDRLHRRGLIERIARGVYVWPNADLGEQQTLIEASVQIPKGIVCLLSALEFHGLTTQQPREVWLAISSSAWHPKIEHPRVHIVRFSGPSFTRYVESYSFHGISIRVYSPAKTVADCFKYRNKIGLDVALEALRDCLRQRKGSVDELFDAARVCRMTGVMRPYLESLA